MCIEYYIHLLISLALSITHQVLKLSSPLLPTFLAAYNSASFKQRSATLAQYYTTYIFQATYKLFYPIFYVSKLQEFSFVMPFVLLDTRAFASLLTNTSIFSLNFIKCFFNLFVLENYNSQVETHFFTSMSKFAFFFECATYIVLNQQHITNCVRTVKQFSF